MIILYERMQTTFPIWRDSDFWVQVLTARQNDLSRFKISVSASAQIKLYLYKGTVGHWSELDCPAWGNFSIDFD